MHSYSRNRTAGREEHRWWRSKRDVKHLENQEFHGDYNLTERNEGNGATQKIVFEAIVEFAKQEECDLILHEGVIHAGTQVDITDKILKKLGEEMTRAWP